MRALLTMGLVAGLAVATAMAQGPTRTRRRRCRRWSRSATWRPTSRCRGPTARRTSSRTIAASRRSSSPVPARVHAGLHHRVQVAGGQRRQDPEVRRRLLHGQHRHDRGQHQVRQGDIREPGGGERRVVEKKEADFPMLSDPTRPVATKYGVLNGEWPSRAAGRSTSTRPGKSRPSRPPSVPRRQPKT